MNSLSLTDLPTTNSNTTSNLQIKRKSNPLSDFEEELLTNKNKIFIRDFACKQFPTLIVNNNIYNPTLINQPTTADQFISHVSTAFATPSPQDHEMFLKKMRDCAETQERIIQNNQKPTQSISLKSKNNTKVSSPKLSKKQSKQLSKAPSSQYLSAQELSIEESLDHIQNVPGSCSDITQIGDYFNNNEKKESPLKKQSCSLDSIDNQDFEKQGGKYSPNTSYSTQTTQCSIISFKNLDEATAKQDINVEKWFSESSCLFDNEFQRKKKSCFEDDCFEDLPDINTLDFVQQFNLEAC